MLSRKICENQFFSALTTVLTLYALFGDNIRLMATSKPADVVFDVFTSFSMVVFVFEIVVASLGKPDYFLGFFFVLDVVSTLSLVLDISAVSNALFCGTGEEDSGSAVRASRASRVGARTARVVRVIRLVRIVKLYKAIQEARARKRREERRKEAALHGQDDDDWLLDEEEEGGKSSGRESRVGKKLSDMTTRKVICLVLVMLFILPYLESSSLSDMPLSGQYGVDMVYKSFEDYRKGTQAGIAYGTQAKTNLTGLDGTQGAYEDELISFLFYHNWHSDGKCPTDACIDTPGASYTKAFWVGFGGKDAEPAELAKMAKLSPGATARWQKENVRQGQRFHVGEMPDYALDALESDWGADCGKRQGVSLIAGGDDPVTCSDELRCNERGSMWDSIEGRLIVQFDKRPMTRMEALLDTLKIFFVCIVLGAGSMMFAKDADTLVLTPLENMISKIEKIRDNPLYAMKLGDEEFKREEVQKAKDKKKSHFQKFMDTVKNFGSPTDHEPMETVILEKTIIKLGTLLALGFGEAGANIIGQNMKGADTAGVNAMIPGHRLDSIIGFISIRDFSTVNEVLQANIMTFANQIAEIVHGIVSEFHGAPNRNNGDSFLLVWQTAYLESEEVQRLAEMSLMGIIRILSALNRSPVLAEYRHHPGLQQRFRKYNVSVGCALHHGWVIEGAIGSEFKIDASYLSPNVTITVAIEEATEVYGTMAHISDDVMSLMGFEMQRKCRLIDRVMVPGSKQPMKLWAVDLNTALLPIEEHPRLEGVTWSLRRRFKARQALETIKAAKLSTTMVSLFDSLEDIRLMRQLFTDRFFLQFGMAYHNYIAGEWQVAMGLLKETHSMLDIADGPSICLMDFIESHNCAPPAGWAGYRDLPKK